ncbi:MAG: hypothetical protein ACE5FK_00435 [Candidatus Methylomirabilia bacterium]
MGSPITRRALVLAAVLGLAPLSVSFADDNVTLALIPEIGTAELCALGSCRPRPGWDCIIDGILVPEKCDTSMKICNEIQE